MPSHYKNSRAISARSPRRCLDQCGALLSKNGFQRGNTLLLLFLIVLQLIAECAYSHEHKEDFTLQLLAKFKTKLHAIKEKAETEGEPSAEKTGEGEDNDENLNSDDWLGHTLRFEEKGPLLAKDASTKGDDWFDIYDPRNPINKRKREKSDKKQKK